MAEKKETIPKLNLTPRQEQFAMEFVATGNAAEAYRRAYSRSRTWKENALYNRASELLKHGEVMVRVEQLREDARGSHEVTIDNVVREYNAIIALAFELKQAGPAITAITKKAELFGLFGKHQGPPLIGMKNKTTGAVIIEVVDPQKGRDED